MKITTGNLLLNFLGEVFEVNSSTILAFESNFHPFGKPSPIPITEEWLLKLGFKKKTEDGGPVGFYDWFENNRYSLTNVGPGIYSIQGIDCEPFTHVHQLQNLYYALTGEELTYEPNINRT